MTDAFRGIHLLSESEILQTTESVTPLLETCPELAIDDLFAPHADPSRDMWIQREIDKAHVEARVRERAYYAEKIDCKGPVDGRCPVRELLNEKQARQTVLGGLRKIIGRSR